MVKIRLLLIGIILLNHVLVYSSIDNYQLSFLSVEDGLSHNEVTSIVQDQYGFMWFGTRGGLNRYDGYEFKHFKPLAQDSTSITNPSIESLFLNSSEEIYIGLKSGGPSKYINSQETFKEFELTTNYGLSRVLSFFEDSKGNTWIGSWSNGIVCIKRDTIIHFKDAGQVRDFAETADGKVWVGSSTGLKYITNNGQLINYGGKSITSITVDTKNECLWTLGWTQELMKVNYKTLESDVYVNNLTSSARNYSVLNDTKGRLWIGTWGEGFFHFDKGNKVFNKVDIYPGNAQSAPVDYRVIRDIFEDKVGDLWLATQGGIVRLSPKNNFNSVKVIDYDKQNISHINAVCVDDEGITWVGTNGNGLFYTEDKNTFHSVGASQVLKNGTVKTINKDPDNNLWVCFEEGIFTIEDKDGSFRLVPVVDLFQQDEFKRVRKVHQLFFDDDKLWIGTQQRGVFLFEQHESKYRLIKHFVSGEEDGMLGDNRVTAIRKDLSGNMWFATYKGLFRFNPHDSTFLSLKDLGISSALACDIILCLELDKCGNLWFGTPCSLHQLQLSGLSKLQTYNKAQGLADDYINGIVVGDNEMIWCSTNAGISSLNPKNGQVLNFGKADGIGDLSYSEGAYYKNADGTIYFGGYTSLSYFKPDDININKYESPLVVSAFKVLNQVIKVGDNDGLLKSNINDLDELTLSHKEMEFSFQVASLDYKAPDKNQYTYRLIPYDSDWHDLGNMREISFSNLKPDTYKLQIKGTNSNGIWSNSLKEITIKVLPAPWKSIYAIFAYVLFILLVVLVIIRTVVRQERLQNALKLGRLQNDQIKEINDYKLRFFTNISHEFRTPLTLIQAPVKELLNKDFSEIKPSFYEERMQMIGHNTNRLYNLVNQLLEFRKMESGKLELRISEVNLQQLINESCLAYKQLAKTQSFRFKVNYKVKNTTVYLDFERITIVLTNLLSNAFKHVEPNGKVDVIVTEDDGYFRIDICNEGKPIPKSEIEHLFERFYQVKGGSSIGSSGIGLQLVKSFVELHKGRVSVSSTEGEPIIFSVYLRKGKEHFSTDGLVNINEHAVLQIEPERPVSKVSVNTGTKGATILIVEDNREVRDYLRQFLGEFFSIVESEDGLDGFDKAIKYKPALVLSDVMMPRMDGYELCEKIKSNDLISDIPVILLTAKGSDSEQLFGSQKGADLYIKKPFNPELLLEEIKQLIASRVLLKEKYSRKVVLEAKKEEISSEEAQFLERSVKIVEKHIKLPDFTPDALSKELAMSSSSFYRKIKKSTNQTPAGFIKSIRLKKAAQLLKDSDLSVSEIIERVGYLDSASFRKNFKEQFGVTPSEYRKKDA
ncbi:hybrid sensor histidine kinase/response regulator transcription factor [Carboxylicivirga marina]|uniref:hybrid sensor histidine kinase/response regulator transcription factor n=1 Tax=Carboxylicivirga marina TaxID=2800988 RepID=UPI00259388A1|nr:hybrid sensor histidine kinase/response regulator transcription factor [uncultured Carboxylicivirga sp.]